MYFCNEQPSRATANPVGGKACSFTKGGLLRYIPNTRSSQSLEFEICISPREAIPLHYFPLREDSPRVLAWKLHGYRHLRSGSCHHPTAATKCNEQPSRATANPVGGRACSSTKGGLLRYIPNTYSIHKVSSLKGPVTGYGKLTWEFAHAWSFMKLCALIVLVMTAIIMAYSLVNAIPLANYDVIYDVTTIAEGTPL